MNIWCSVKSYFIHVLEQRFWLYSFISNLMSQNYFQNFGNEENKTVKKYGSPTNTKNGLDDLNYSLSDSNNNGVKSNSCPDSTVANDTVDTLITNLQTYREQHMKNYEIIVEFKRLRRSAPDGIYLFPSWDSLKLYFGVVFVHSGFYKGGIFKFRIELPDEYPMDGVLPKLIFTSEIFHPSVFESSGELDLQSRYPQWKAGTNQLVSVLRYLRQLLHHKNYHTSKNTTWYANHGAVELFRKDILAFRAKVNKCVVRSIQNQYVSEPGSTLIFSKPSPEIDALFEKVSSFVKNSSPDDRPVDKFIDANTSLSFSP